MFKASLLDEVGSTVWVNIKEQGKVKTFQLNTITKAIFNFIGFFKQKNKEKSSDITTAAAQFPFSLAD